MMKMRFSARFSVFFAVLGACSQAFAELPPINSPLTTSSEICVGDNSSPICKKIISMCPMTSRFLLDLTCKNADPKKSAPAPSVVAAVKKTVCGIDSASMRGNPVSAINKLFDPSVVNIYMTQFFRWDISKTSVLYGVFNFTTGEAEVVIKKFGPNEDNKPSLTPDALLTAANATDKEKALAKLMLENKVTLSALNGLLGPAGIINTGFNKDYFQYSYNVESDNPPLLTVSTDAENKIISVDPTFTCIDKKS